MGTPFGYEAIDGVRVEQDLGLEGLADPVGPHRQLGGDRQQVVGPQHGPGRGGCHSLFDHRLDTVPDRLRHVPRREAVDRAAHRVVLADRLTSVPPLGPPVSLERSVLRCLGNGTGIAVAPDAPVLVILSLDHPCLESNDCLCALRRLSLSSLDTLQLSGTPQCLWVDVRSDGRSLRTFTNAYRTRKVKCWTELDGPEMVSRRGRSWANAPQTPFHLGDPCSSGGRMPQADARTPSLNPHHEHEGSGGGGSSCSRTETTSARNVTNASSSLGTSIH